MFIIIIIINETESVTEVTQYKFNIYNFQISFKEIEMPIKVLSPMYYTTHELLQLLETKQSISKVQSILTGFINSLPHTSIKMQYSTPLLHILNEEQLK